MKKVYVFNTAIVPNPGTYRYKLITINDAKNILKNSTEIISAIGHPGTAYVLSMLFEKEIEVNRINAKLDVSDIAIVFRPKQRLPEGTVLDKDALLEMLKNDLFEFGLLERIE